MSGASSKRLAETRSKQFSQNDFPLVAETPHQISDLLVNATQATFGVSLLTSWAPK
jgi:hypothetical protein